MHGKTSKGVTIGRLGGRLLLLKCIVMGRVRTWLKGDHLHEAKQLVSLAVDERVDSAFNAILFDMINAPSQEQVILYYYKIYIWPLFTKIKHL